MRPSRALQTWTKCIKLSDVHLIPNAELGISAAGGPAGLEVHPHQLHERQRQARKLLVPSDACRLPLWQKMLASRGHRTMYCSIQAPNT